MENNRMPKKIITYKLRWKRNLGRPLKGWYETVTGHMA
jgi:hypothetical protein